MYKYRLTTFGKILVSSLVIILVCCSLTIINSLIIKSSAPSKGYTPVQNSGSKIQGGSTGIQDTRQANTAEADYLKYLKAIKLTVYYEPNAATIKQESFQTLNVLAALSNILKSYTIQIEGNTASIYDVKDNAFDEELSMKRAKAVADYLIEKGIAAGRLTVISNGYKKPAAANDTEEHRSLNRRADITFK